MEQYKNKQELTDLRNQLYDLLPTGEIHAFDMTLAVKRMFEHFDNAIDEMQEPVSAPSVPPDVNGKSPDQIWDEFWGKIVCNEDGTVNIDQLKKELADFSFVLDQLPKVYCHITGSRMSNAMYKADDVIRVADDYQQELFEEWKKDETEEEGQIAGVRWVKASGRLPEKNKRFPAKYNGHFGEAVLIVDEITGTEFYFHSSHFQHIYQIVDKDLEEIFWLDESGSSLSTAAKDYEKLYKETNQFILDLAKEFGEDSLGFDGIQWSIEDFKEAAKKYSAAKEQETAIAFANWIAFRHTPHDIDTWDGGSKNTHELYDDFENDLFLQSQTK